jgi:hypothetical protein
MAISKFSGIAWDDIAEVDGIAKASIAEIGGSAAPATAGGATTCVIGSQDGYFAWSTGSADGWAASTWHFYRTARTADDVNDLDYGLDNLGNPFWMCTINKTARPTYYSTSSVPKTGSNWGEQNTIGKTGYGITYGINANAGIANWVVTGDDCRIAEVTNNPPETAGNWTKTNRMTSGFSSRAEVRDVAFNNDGDNPIFVAVTNNGRIASSPSAADGTWTVRQAAGDTDTALWRVVHGNGVWVACGYYGNMKHMTGSANGETWGTMNLPSGDPTRTMYGAANDGGNNWVMVGALGYVWRSSDNAVSWTESQIANSEDGNSTIYDVAYDGAGTWVACGQASEIWTSTDNGANWTNLIDVAGDWAYDAYQNFMAISFNRIA